MEKNKEITELKTIMNYLNQKIIEKDNEII